MKTKIASWILFFFALIPAFSAEVPSLKDAGDKADNIVKRTIGRLHRSWLGVKENISFAYYTLRDKAVYSKREAEARTRLAVKEAQEKAKDMISDAKDKADDTIDDAKDAVKEKYRKAKKKAGEIIE